MSAPCLISRDQCVFFCILSAVFQLRALLYVLCAFFTLNKDYLLTYLLTYPHLLLRSVLRPRAAGRRICSNRSISPAIRTHHSKPAAAIRSILLVQFTCLTS